tara:strand:- start:110 stop:511 length:402 start_codon:yes stop_codon:yes gene_type:complete
MKVKLSQLRRVVRKVIRESYSGDFLPSNFGASEERETTPSYESPLVEFLYTREEHSDLEPAELEAIKSVWGRIDSCFGQVPPEQCAELISGDTDPGAIHDATDIMGAFCEMGYGGSADWEKLEYAFDVQEIMG